MIGTKIATRMTVSRLASTAVPEKTVAKAGQPQQLIHQVRGGSSMQRRLNIAVGLVTTVVLVSGTIQAGSFYFAIEVAAYKDELAVPFGPNDPVQNKPVDRLKQDSSGSGGNLVKPNHLMQQTKHLQDLLQIFEMAKHFEVTAATFLSSPAEKYFPKPILIRDRIAGPALDREPRFIVGDTDTEADCRVMPSETSYEILIQPGHTTSTSTIPDFFVSLQTPDEPTSLLGDPSVVGYEKMARRNKPDLGLLVAQL
jgi:hypothetical protein